MVEHGWTPGAKRAMMAKLTEFYEEFYYRLASRNIPNFRAWACDKARRRMDTLVNNDPFTCGEILQLLMDSVHTTDVAEKRHQLLSIFRLMLVYDESSSSFGELYTLWRKVMTGQNTQVSIPLAQTRQPASSRNDDDDNLLDFYAGDNEKYPGDNQRFECYLQRGLKK